MKEMYDESAVINPDESANIPGGLIGTPIERGVAIASVRDFESSVRWKILREQEQPSTGITLSKHLDRWANRYHGTRTGGDYRSLCDNHIKPALGHYLLCDLTTSMIQDVVDELKSVRNVGSDGKPLGLSSTTKRHVRVCLHTALEVAVAEGKIGNNPATRVQVKRDGEEDSEVNPFSEEELNTLLAARQIPYYDLNATAAWTGMRRNEVIALRRRDFGYDKRNRPFLRVERSYDEKSHRFKTCKNRQKRTVSLWPHTEEIITRRLQEPGGPDDLIFPGQKGKPLYPTTISHSFKESLRILGLPHRRFHDLRHTHATILFANGWSLPDVSKRLGHKDPSVTLKVYSHYIPGRQAQLIEENSALAKAPVSSIGFEAKVGVARPEGFEPPTLGSEDRCSFR